MSETNKFNLFWNGSFKQERGAMTPGPTPQISNSYMNCCRNRRLLSDSITANNDERKYVSDCFDSKSEGLKFF